MDVIDQLRGGNNIHPYRMRVRLVLENDTQVIGSPITFDYNWIVVPDKQITGFDIRKTIKSTINWTHMIILASDRVTICVRLVILCYESVKETKIPPPLQSAFAQT